MKRLIFYTGTGNLRNHGEYAMVAGLSAALAARAPETSFVMLSKKPEENRAILGGLPVAVVPEFWFERRGNKLYYLLTLAGNLARVGLGRVLPLPCANPTLKELMV